MSYLKVKSFGQVFTPDKIVQDMLALRQNKGSVLEPSCGNGAFLNKLDKATGIELDKNLIQSDHFITLNKNLIKGKPFPQKRNKNLLASYRLSQTTWLKKKALPLKANNPAQRMANLDKTDYANTYTCLEPAPRMAGRLNKTDPKTIIQGDFFAYPTVHKFDTIIGNPPYVRHQDILPETKKLLNMEGFDRRTNLYLFFIAKSLDHLNKGGELIFITPRDFLKATSAKKLNQRLYEEGTVTYYRELGDSLIFAGYAPNCAIWRWEKSCPNRQVSSGQGWFNEHEGQLWFGPKNRGHLSDFFEVKVGAVSGADHIFANKKRGNANMVCSMTAQTGKTRRMIYNQKDRSLLPYKKELLNRRIRAFNENNWWEWGRKYCEREQARIYVNCKTRNPKPFFTHPSKEYDGSVMALFPKKSNMDIERAVNKLNRIKWNELGFECDGRLLFTQRSLSKAPVGL